MSKRKRYAMLAGTFLLNVLLTVSISVMVTMTVMQKTDQTLLPNPMPQYIGKVEV